MDESGMDESGMDESGQGTGPGQPRAWWRGLAPDAVAGVVAAGIGLAEIGLRSRYLLETASPFFVVLVAVAIVLARKAPGVALAVVWCAGVAQLVSGTPLLVTELLLVYVAFAGALWGSRWVLALSGASIPAGVLVGGVALLVGSYSPGVLVSQGLREVLNTLSISVLTALPLALLALAASWLGGLALRYQGRAAVSRREKLQAEEESDRAHQQTAQAYEIARLRDEQTRLARDVHDVVGHSLAVILAQAESGQFLPDSDPAALKSTLQTIAGTARSSLRDVQGVLSATPVPPGRLQALIDGADGTGFTIDSTSTGPARALPPELAAVAYRVLQEMLTNALKHGDRAVPVRVVQRWPEASEEELELFVANGVPAGGSPAKGGGRGLDGMRRRLEGVGGRMQTSGDGQFFSVTARVPVRS